MPKPSVQQLKGMQRFKLGMWKGLPFFNRRYTKGASSSPGRFSLGLEVGPRPQSQGKALWGRGCERGTFYGKKGERVDLGAEPPHIKLCWVPLGILLFSPFFSPLLLFCAWLAKLTTTIVALWIRQQWKKLVSMLLYGSTSNDWQETRKKLTNCRFLLDKKLIVLKLETSWLH